MPASSLATRTCPVCEVSFQPRRVDQFFDVQKCRDDLYAREYEVLFLEFPKALLSQVWTCFNCGVDAQVVRLKPLFLRPSDENSPLVAACQPCKRDHYLKGAVEEMIATALATEMAIATTASS